ncbi:hypothetical protein DJ90_6360 [Paenibacillus macerans]|uniref:Uncharacterized protein n=1 Tax=Paenibacillus macerans TaxID=44252 RepID=A0A090XWC0_PAEMA|nr:hypothetical protein DJ90_6360 [Paenibacillus macerans]
MLKIDSCKSAVFFGVNYERRGKACSSCIFAGICVNSLGQPKRTAVLQTLDDMFWKFGSIEA